ncbi:hypothetical protein VTL71DRAFT_7747 [Oculimacula yallundae]|uniref:Uncharacterized protein n=1 Tax=Oculimacula yallundae TaxID=86028 RepID=A0ABR4CY27_9HELO
MLLRIGRPRRRVNLLRRGLVAEEGLVAANMSAVAIYDAAQQAPRRLGGYPADKITMAAPAGTWIYQQVLFNAPVLPQRRTYHTCKVGSHTWYFKVLQADYNWRPEYFVYDTNCPSCTAETIPEYITYVQSCPLARHDPPSVTYHPWKDDQGVFLYLEGQPQVYNQFFEPRTCHHQLPGPESSMTTIVGRSPAIAATEDIPYNTMREMFDLYVMRMVSWNDFIPPEQYAYNRAVAKAPWGRWDVRGRLGVYHANRGAGWGAPPPDMGF